MSTSSARLAPSPTGHDDVVAELQALFGADAFVVPFDKHSAGVAAPCCAAESTAATW